MRRAMVCVLLGGLTPSAGAENAPPNVYFSVAYRQKEGQPLSRSVHFVKFSCWGGECELTTLTLNQCMGEERLLGFRTDHGKFYPQIERVSTRDGDLRVRVEGPGVLVAEWSISNEGATLTHRFVYEAVTSVAGKTLLPSRTLTGFSGAAVKTSHALQKMVAWQFEPLRGRSPTIELDCPVLLDGIE